MRPHIEPDAERAAYAAVDEALRTYPLRPVPPGLTAAVMATVQGPSENLARRPVFRLQWIDLALSGFAALMVGVVVLLLGQLLTPEVAARMGIQAMLPQFQATALAWVLALAGLVVASGLLGLGALVLRPRSFVLHRRSGG
jgi:hypothetical protein